jgi:hypothetical protein
VKALYVLPLLMLSALALTGCSSDNKKSKAPSETFVTVLGDPIKIIGNAQTNADFSTSDFKDGETLAIMSSIAFEEKKAFVPTDKQTILAQNKTAGQKQSASRPATDQFLFHVKVLNRDHIEFRNSNNGFELKKVNGEAIVTTSSGIEARLLHLSISKDKKTMSFLIYLTDPSTGLRSLSALYFSRGSKSRLNRTDKPYEYFAGTGVKIAWPKTKPAQLSLCNSDSESQQVAAANSISQWQSALRGSLKIDYEGPTERYPPFSDLNFRCIYIVDTYISEPNPALANTGKTVIIPNIEKSEISDADVMIFKTEFKKRNRSENQHKHAIDLAWTMLHELGHFLGLGHQFNGTKSIMSYDNNKIATIESHDVEAIRELYK